MDQSITGVSLIAAERERHLTQEGWTPEHDDTATKGELADAAACYAANAALHNHPHAHNCTAYDPPKMWPWARKYWKPATPIRMLVKAGALIAAEIDRRLRAGEQP